MTTHRVANEGYLTCAETAKFVRRDLKAAFPGIKFSVRSSVYSGGASIDIHWTDGPRRTEVDPIGKRYEGASFDGMIDMKYSNYHWLLPDGTVCFAHTPGTQGSMGLHPAEDYTKPDPDAQLVHFGANYVFTNRSVSNFDVFKAKHLAYIREHCATDGEEPNDRFGNQWVDALAQSMTHDRGEGEATEAVFRRVVLREGG